MSTRTATARRSPAKLRDDYVELLRAFPLRPIRSEREYGAATAVLDRLAVQPEGSLTPGEQDYFEALTLMVGDYDERHVRLKTARMKPLEALKYLMTQHEMTGADLGRLLGNNRALASLILNGHRQLSKTHIRILAEHFKVEPSLFL